MHKARVLGFLSFIYLLSGRREKGNLSPGHLWGGGRLAARGCGEALIIITSHLWKVLDFLQSTLGRVGVEE